MIEFPLKGQGVLKYDPPRGDMRSNTKGWLIVDVDRELTRYYRSWLKREKHIHLELPAWNAHISLVAGAPIHPSKQHLWKKYQGKKLLFSYEHGDICKSKDTKAKGWYYWIRAACPEGTEIRRELGLTPYETFHITIGRTYY
jgi:hypothetical protein